MCKDALNAIQLLGHIERVLGSNHRGCGFADCPYRKRAASRYHILAVFTYVYELLERDDLHDKVQELTTQNNDSVRYPFLVVSMKKENTIDAQLKELRKDEYYVVFPYEFEDRFILFAYCPEP